MDVKNRYLYTIDLGHFPSLDKRTLLLRLTKEYFGIKSKTINPSKYCGHIYLCY